MARVHLFSSIPVLLMLINVHLLRNQRKKHELNAKIQINQIYIYKNCPRDSSQSEYHVYKGKNPNPRAINLY